MLIEKDSYRRNKKSGEIIKRQIVLVKCDDCEEEWESLFGNRKRKKFKKDLCKSCRSKFNLTFQEPLNDRRWSKVDNRVDKECHFCKKNIKKYPSQVSKNNNFCDMRCRDKYVLKKYDILYDVFDKNPDEVAYLFGLILGDGYLRKLDQQNTTRIDISFNIREKDMIELAKNVMSKLKINFYSQIQKKCNCLHFGFVLPDNLLKKYNMLWRGSKFKADPYPNKTIIENINMVIGLINSDGCCLKRKEKIKYIVFSNTVKSIYQSFIDCLDFHNIYYNSYINNGRIDSRTGNRSKDSFCAGLKLGSVNKIFSLKRYFLKGECVIG